MGTFQSKKGHSEQRANKELGNKLHQIILCACINTQQQIPPLRIIIMHKKKANEELSSCHQREGLETSLVTLESTPLTAIVSTALEFLLQE